MMKDLGARAFNYGYASPVLMVATYNDDGSVNVMNLHIWHCVSANPRRRTRTSRSEGHLR